ncbi:MAG: ABC transporter permease, partial [bacterium]
MLLQRLAQMGAVIVVVVAITFLILRLSGDPVRILLAPDTSEAEVAAARRRYGFDDPVYVQLWRYYARMVHGDFGRSWRFHEPALPVVLQRLPATLLLATTALTVSVIIALPLGVAAAARRGSIWDSLSMAAALAGQSMPVFWIGILLVLVFSLMLHLLPTSGYGTVKHLILPSLALGTYSAGRLARLIRAQLLDVLGEDYIRTAWSKG